MQTQENLRGKSAEGKNHCTKREIPLMQSDYIGFLALYYIFNSLGFDPLQKRKRSTFIAEGSRAELWPPRFPPLDLPTIVTACNTQL